MISLRSQLVEEISHPPCLVLEYLDDNILNASSTKKLSKREIKLVARSILEALNEFHDNGYVNTGTSQAQLRQLNVQHSLHVDVKQDNIFVNYDNGPDRFSKVQLGDFGDVYRMNPEVDSKVDGHIIGAAIFRNPEAMLSLRWGPPTDI